MNNNPDRIFGIKISDEYKPIQENKIIEEQTEFFIAETCSLKKLIENSRIINLKGDVIKFILISTNINDVDWNLAKPNGVCVTSKYKVEKVLNIGDFIIDEKVRIKEFVRNSNKEVVSNKEPFLHYVENEKNILSLKNELNLTLDGNNNTVQANGERQYISINGNKSNLFLENKFSKIFLRGADNNVVNNGFLSELSIMGANNCVILKNDIALISDNGYKSLIIVNNNFKNDKNAEDPNTVNITSSGRVASIICYENFSNISACGSYSDIIAYGDKTKLLSSGKYSRLKLIGDDSIISSSGYGDNINSEGFRNTILVNGEESIVVSKDCNSKIILNGNLVSCFSTGKNNVIVVLGFRASFRGKNGTKINAAHYDYVDRTKLLGWKTGIIGHDGLKEDVDYSIENGKFIEVYWKFNKALEDFKKRKENEKL